MANRLSLRAQRVPHPLQIHHRHPTLLTIRPSGRPFTTSKSLQQQQQQQHRKQSFRSRLRASLGATKVQWRPIPVGLGIAFLGAWQFYRVQARARERAREEVEGERLPRKRHRISGPWTVQIMSTLPLKALSRLWGRFNELDIPYYLRVPGFRLYSFIFGVNLSEVSEPDLHVYPNLASFFYRTLKPGVRPLDPNPNAVLSPADGKIIQFGTIKQGGEVEQVKGVTYSLDALLGSQSPSSSRRSSFSEGSMAAPTNQDNAPPFHTHDSETDEEVIHSEEEFARVNGISYTLPNLFSGSSQADQTQAVDQSTPSKPSSEAEVRADLALSSRDNAWWNPFASNQTTALYYCVVYLAPGDYHRFHSPVAWVVESRRHFAGELYSVSPYLQKRLPGLFTLNERVVLLGRWKWGFFSYTPVGATNVGSIRINFDNELRTNSLTTDTAADRAADEAKQRGEIWSGFAEATYENASAVLGGYALKRGEEMGGFQLGSTIVLVFEGPRAGAGEEQAQWKWNIDPGKRVKVGEALGYIEEKI